MIIDKRTNLDEKKKEMHVLTVIHILDYVNDL